MSSNENNDNSAPVEAQGRDGDPPALGFEDAVEQQPDLDEENRRRFPQIPPLALHPWEGIEQEVIGEEDDDDNDEIQEMNVFENNLNHEHEQLNRLQEQIRNIQRHLLFDLNNQREDPEDMNDDDDDDDDNEDWEDAEVASSGEENEASAVAYDRLLPTTHSYMNVQNFQEFSGVSLLSDDRRSLLHIVELANMILIPNQSVPWQVFNTRTARMIKEAKQENRLFGVIDACSSLLTNDPKYGTTAEIVSYYEELNDESLQLKIIGRQRFIIDDPSTMKRDLNGILRAYVRILPDLQLKRPPLPVISQNYIHTINFVLQYDLCLQRQKRLNQKCVDNNEHQTVGCGQALINLIKRKRTASSSSTTSHDSKSLVLPNLSKQHFFRMRSRTSPWSLTPYPYWVIRRYDDVYIMSLVKIELNNTMIANDDGSLPVTPDRFADWLLINIPFEIQTVQKILSFPTTIQRLRFVLSWLRRYKRFACRHCAADICEDRDIFSMSATGLMAAYVNPHGQIHETLTVLQAKNIRLLGHEVAEHSWFPGYKWTIVQCRLCSNHLGWRFRNPSLKPSTFYGLTRNGLIFTKNTSENDKEEEIEEPRPRRQSIVDEE
ncbi:unnamed protein product [Rotaria magnacalcarata]|uniref:Protein cereblon n=1 Tax=Rotaria magnacalcarata TaxID=392030 RepID=A0A815KES9_9BILA|nr:unnamed protein product [Rotaria magnacalcarata]CAF2111527.1 unnamed protein product [Rotaria magnacalcarata]CAF2247689.1 unnamed protein product [Rotaria magnacalcarata]